MYTVWCYTHAQNHSRPHLVTSLALPRLALVAGIILSIALGVYYSVLPILLGTEPYMWQGLTRHTMSTQTWNEFMVREEPAASVYGYTGTP